MALLSGLVIGLAFGALQAAASRRYLRKQTEGKFKSGWSVTPGSMGRVAILLIALAFTQAVFPIFFTPGGISQWCVALGVVAGYGLTLYRQMRMRVASIR
ncbi:MAG TPA: hypothetical protein VFE25_14335 [Opitutaceae bacterium]|nr:hypothetical protein [Opitutaceae bacterium]